MKHAELAEMGSVLQTIDGSSVKVLRIIQPQGLPDVIECDHERYARQEVCCYVPEELKTVYDEEGNEVETFEPDDDCEVFGCSACGNPMMFSRDGDGWFDEVPPYKPRFSYCPNCGARVTTIEEVYGDEQR